MLGITVILISRLRAMFWSKVQKPGLSAELHETGSEMWGMGSGRLRKTNPEIETDKN